MAPTREAALVREIRAAVVREFPAAWTFKPVGHPYQERGVPDLLVCVDGRLIGLEVKHAKPGESDAHARSRASPDQLRHIDRIREAGGAAEVVVSVDEALGVIREAVGSGLT